MNADLGIVQVVLQGPEGDDRICRRQVCMES